MPPPLTLAWGMKDSKIVREAVMSRHVTSCHVMSHHVTSCYVMSGCSRRQGAQYYDWESQWDYIIGVREKLFPKEEKEERYVEDQKMGTGAQLSANTSPVDQQQQSLVIHVNTMLHLLWVALAYTKLSRWDKIPTFPSSSCCWIDICENKLGAMR